ncbi:protein PATRONUS 1-like [Forsythia ovata]|uniref:Protein PATRONUS 1-like n=1 Tax=Forsythia ovata TaxID=205694 RepID=A0ABD1X2H8_9LAMI
MATPASHLIQDQNLNILSNGATLRRKTGITKADKKGGLGGRKALNDISNSRNGASLRSKKDNSINVVSTGKDLSASKTKSVVGGKAGGRKALTDLTNSVKPSSHAVLKKGQKLNPVAEENVPISIEEEGFLHNHQECIKAQRKAMDMLHFLNSDIPVWPSSPRALVPSYKPKKSPVKHLEMEEIADLLFQDPVSSCYSSPSWGSPKSPKLPFTNWMDDSFSNFVLRDTPKLLNP